MDVRRCQRTYLLWRWRSTRSCRTAKSKGSSEHFIINSFSSCQAYSSSICTPSLFCNPLSASPAASRWRFPGSSATSQHPSSASYAHSHSYWISVVVGGWNLKFAGLACHEAKWTLTSLKCLWHFFHCFFQRQFIFPWIFPVWPPSSQ